MMDRPFFMAWISRAMLCLPYTAVVLCLRCFDRSLRSLSTWTASSLVEVRIRLWGPGASGSVNCNIETPKTVFRCLDASGLGPDDDVLLLQYVWYVLALYFGWRGVAHVILDKLHLLTPLGSVCYDVEKLTGSRHSGNSHIANV